jgi:hypothetical protein
MISLQLRLAAVTDTTANLKTQLSELNRLREQVRKAELRDCGRKAITFGALNRKALTPSLNLSGNRRSFSPT